MDPAPLFVQGAEFYVHIRYAPFVALEIFGGVFMRFRFWIGLFSECYKIAGWRGLKACAKYLCGLLEVEDFPRENIDFYIDFYIDLYLGDPYA